MTVALDRTTLARISEEARAVQFGRFVLGVVAGMLYAAGWFVSWLCLTLWHVAAWVGVAVKLGWSDARKSDRRTSEPN